MQFTDKLSVHSYGGRHLSSHPSSLETTAWKTLRTMSTLADELLNDFEDSGSDGEADRFLHDEPSSPQPSAAKQSSTLNGSSEGIIMDVDEEEDDDEEDMEMGNVGSRVSDSVEPADDEEEAKAKVEKMHLGGVSDVRNVAGLMKTLEPVLEVGYALLSPTPALCEAQGLHLPRTQP